MKLIHNMSLGTRISLAFSLISCMVFLSIALLSYQNMQQILYQQQDQALQARIQRIELFLEDKATFQILVQHPKLYENMLGEEDSLLVLKNKTQTFIDINPLDIQLPIINDSNKIEFLNDQKEHQKMRLAYQTLHFDGQQYQLIAGKQLNEAHSILKNYMWKLFFNSLLGILISSILGWWIGHYFLRSMKKLTLETRQINTQQLSHRIQTPSNGWEVIQLSQAMNEMLDRIQTNYEQLARFSEDIAHELRTPLNNLIGQTQIALSQSREKEDLENLLYSHLEEYERLTQMIENMLFIARSEQKEYPLEKSDLDLKVLFSELFDYFSFLAEEKGMDFRISIPDDLIIHANADLLKRALSNLIINAIDYGQEDGLISIEVHQLNSKIEILVLSYGIFVGEQHLKFLFDRFYQVAESRHEKAQTGGLGLAIVQSIMNLHHGETQVENSAQGIVFRLSFPQN